MNRKEFLKQVVCKDIDQLNDEYEAQCEAEYEEDIEYLVKQGYSFRTAIEILESMDKYR